jgi:hypothetical protein
MLAVEAVLLSVVATVLGTLIGVAFAWVALEALVKAVADRASMVLPWGRLALVVLVAGAAGLWPACCPPDGPPGSRRQPDWWSSDRRTPSSSVSADSETASYSSATALWDSDQKPVGFAGRAGERPMLVYPVAPAGVHSVAGRESERNASRARKSASVTMRHPSRRTFDVPGSTGVANH